MENDRVDVPHPGYFIREELEARAWSQRDLAYVLGVSDPEINVIISGKRGISAEMAKALGKAFDVPAEFFANLQKAHELSKAREPDPSVERRARLQTIYPVREMIKRGWLTDANAAILESEMARFFEVDTPDKIPHMAHAARKTNYDEVSAPQLAWLFRARQIAKEMPASTYSDKALREALTELRHLMVDPADIRHVPHILERCGVRYVVVEALPSAKIDGACFWLNKLPVIGMSLRFDRIDNFWFVLRHEIEHVLRGHGKQKDIVDELEGERASADGNIPQEERDANRAATDFCVPSAEMDSFIARKQPFFSERDLLGFARRLQTHPGIVAGQLRNRIDRWDLFTKMLVKVRSSIVPSATSDGWGHVAPVSI